MSSSRKDTWARGDLYEPYVGRWSRLVAREFLAWLAAPPNSAWLDVGCGTGALTQVILEVEAPRSVVGIDPSDGSIAYARDRMRDNRARVQVADAQSLPFDAARFDAVVSGLVLNFVPDPARVVAEMKRVARPGGTSRDHAERLGPDWYWRPAPVQEWNGTIERVERHHPLLPL